MEFQVFGRPVGITTGVDGELTTVYKLDREDWDRLFSALAEQPCPVCGAVDDDSCSCVV